MSAAGLLPLLTHGPDDPIAWRAGQATPLTSGDYLAEVAQVAAGLPDRPCVVNLCQDRYWFCVAFAAAMVRGQTSLLPGNSLPSTVGKTLETYPDGYALSDSDVQSLLRDGAAESTAGAATIPSFAATRTAAITFTSGSTGEPQPVEKTWGEMVTGAHLAQRRFAVTPETAIVATVPAQHMYGLETSVMLPLIAGASVHGGRPLFPADVVAALATVNGRRVLIATPAHLRVCAQTPLQWPPLELIISATAPLTKTAAARAERMLGAPVMEIYGCTEGGSLASRRTVSDDAWQTYDGITLASVGGDQHFSGGHLRSAVAPNDRIERCDEHRFRLLDRQADMVNVAGKRESLANLNQQLNGIEGVDDGVFIAPDDNDSDHRVQRLSALAVAPYLSEQAIMRALAARIDSAFLPRPLHKVEQLPRNATGKLPRQALVALLRNLTSRNTG